MKRNKHFSITYIIANRHYPFFYKVTIFQNFKGKPKKLIIEEINENELYEL